MFTKTISYAGVLIALECIYHVFVFYTANPDANIFTHVFHAGWGLCSIC